MGDPDPSVYILCNVPYTEDDDVCEPMKYIDGINSTCARLTTCNVVERCHSAAGRREFPNHVMDVVYI